MGNFVRHTTGEQTADALGDIDPFTIPGVDGFCHAVEVILGTDCLTASIDIYPEGVTAAGRKIFTDTITASGIYLIRKGCVDQLGETIAGADAKIPARGNVVVAFDAVTAEKSLEVRLITTDDA